MHGRSVHFLEQYDTSEELYQNPIMYLYALALSAPAVLDVAATAHVVSSSGAPRGFSVADTVGDKLEVIAEGQGNVKGLRLRLSSL